MTSASHMETKFWVYVGRACKKTIPETRPTVHNSDSGQVRDPNAVHATYLQLFFRLPGTCKVKASAW